MSIQEITKYVKRSTAWSDLRHDRERKVYIEGFWRGVGFGLQQAGQGYYARQRLLEFLREAAENGR